MQNKAEFDFFCAMMKKIHLNTTVFPAAHPPVEELDVFHLEGYEEHARDFFARAKERVLYVVRDVFLFSFCYILLPETDNIFAVGPYLPCEISEHELMNLLEANHLSPTLLTPMTKYFTSMPIVMQEDRLIAQLEALCDVFWGSEDGYETSYISSSSLSSWAENTKPVVTIEDNQFAASEARHDQEKELMFLVSQGNSTRAQQLVSDFNESKILVHTADPLRNMKNYGIVLNTLLRKAAEEGGVHPMHTSQLGLQMAQRLESARTREECRKLYSGMVHKYCLLVRNYSMKGYSQLVRSVMLRVEEDLKADLSLKAHAEALNVNASYLSTLFKKETGQTLTDYVTRMRMENAIFLLNTTDMQVQTIAQYCGIPDVNYFTKTFKRIIGKTPKEYRAQALQADFSAAQ